MLQRTLLSASDVDVANVCLEVAKKLTDSQFGLIGEINQDGCLDTIALSDPGWKVCRIPQDDSVKMIKNMKIRGIWGSIILNNESQIVNDPASHPDSVGVPEGHPPLTSFLGVPLKRAGKTIGMIALGNKPSGYSYSDQENIEDLSVVFVEALHRKRTEMALQDREARLAESNQILSAVLTHTHMMAVLLDPQFNFICVNPSYAATCGHEPSFFPGKNHFDLYPHEENQAIFQQVVDTGEPRSSWRPSRSCFQTNKSAV